MLKNSVSRNQRLKGVKTKLAFRMVLVMAVGLWMIYQLRLFLGHRLAISENGGLVKEEVIGRPERLKLGRKGLVMPDGDRSESNETEEAEEQDEMEQIEYLVDGVEKGGDDEDEGPEIEPLDDPSEENDDENVNSIVKTGDDNSSRRLKKDAPERIYEAMHKS